MYPYDDNNNNNLNNENEDVSASENDSDGSYRMTRPDAGRSFDAKERGQDPCYRDANYTSENGSAGYYSPTPPSRPDKKSKKARRGMPAAAVVALCLCCALVGGGVGGVLANTVSESAAPEPTLSQENTPTTSASPVAHTSGEMSATDIYYDLAVKQVVGVSTEITTTNFWGMTVKGSVKGSGFVISSDGYILTNYHVIEDAYNGGYDITVMFSDESGYDKLEYTAEFIGGDRNNDVAVIKIDATGLSAVTLGNSDELQVGDTVYAVGNPLGELNYSMSDGMVSATDRVITTQEGRANMFQLTAAVNEGNSGGPVYNAYGQVVGIVTAKPNETSAEGIGFAIPINDAVRIADDTINNGGESVTEPAFLGVTPKDVDSSAMMYYNYPSGAFVYEVTEGGPAEQAGILVGDIITELDGYSVSSSSELREELGYHSAGETVTVTVYRSGAYQELTVTLGSAPETDAQDSGNTGGLQQLPGYFG